MIIETKDLILKKDISKANIEKLHHNVFSQNETAKYMLWRASDEIEWTIKKIKSWQESNIELFFVYKKSTYEPIGFLSFSQDNSTIKNIGLCIGKNFVRRGYGKEVLAALLNYCECHHIKVVEYSAFHENIASTELAKKLGFIYSHSKSSTRNHDKLNFIEDVYIKKL